LVSCYIVNYEKFTELREKQLHETLERLTDESQSYLLGVLEALLFAQGEGEMAVLEPEAAQQ